MTHTYFQTLHGHYHICIHESGLRYVVLSGLDIPVKILESEHPDAIEFNDNYDLLFGNLLTHSKITSNVY